ncbi:MAG: hypothetical protein WC028_20210 [Candidatus Obscuribacterales bacterium]|jgi:hypothetical protein
MIGRKLLVGLAVAIIASSSTLLSGCGAGYKPTGLALPEKFPIACYPGTECTKSDSTPVAPNKYRQVVILKSNDEFDKILNFYKNEIAMKSYRLLSDNNMRGTITLECTSDWAKLDIILVPIGAQTVICITYDPKLDPAQK